MHILILGGTRFVGPFVVSELLAAGHDVTLFHRNPHDGDPDGVRHVYGDLDQFADSVPRLRSLAPDLVLDMIPFRQEHGRRVREFKGVASHGVVISSIDVYRAFGRLHGTEPGPPEPVPLDELSPLRAVLVEPSGLDPLDYNKTGVELEARSDPDFPVTVLRLPGIHGPGDYYNRLYAYVRRMDDGRPAIVLEETHARWIWVRGYVENVAHAVAIATVDENAAGRTYNVADPICVSEVDWVRKIADVHGWTGEIVTVTREQAPELAVGWNTAQDYDVSTERIRSELGFAEIVDEATALAHTIEWERASPPAEADRREPDYMAEDAVLASWRETSGAYSNDSSRLDRRAS